MDLRNANIIVTGGAKGMGKHFAEAAAKAGAKVFVGDVDENGLAELPDTIGHAHLDVSSAESRKAFLSQASASMGTVNVLLNNAGILRDALLVKKDRQSGDISVLDEATWKAVLDVNLTGATMMVRDTVENMLQWVSPKGSS